MTIDSVEIATALKGFAMTIDSVEIATALKGFAMTVMIKTLPLIDKGSVIFHLFVMPTGRPFAGCGCRP